MPLDELDPSNPQDALILEIQLALLRAANLMQESYIKDRIIAAKTGDKKKVLAVDIRYAVIGYASLYDLNVGQAFDISVKMSDWSSEYQIQFGLSLLSELNANKGNPAAQRDILKNAKEEADKISAMTPNEQKDYFSKANETSVNQLEKGSHKFKLQIIPTAFVNRLENYLSKILSRFVPALTVCNMLSIQMTQAINNAKQDKMATQLPKAVFGAFSGMTLPGSLAEITPLIAGLTAKGFTAAQAGKILLPIAPALGETISAAIQNGQNSIVEFLFPGATKEDTDTRTAKEKNIDNQRQRFNTLANNFGIFGCGNILTGNR